jgi:TrmH family RNA methyltransferase
VPVVDDRADERASDPVAALAAIGTTGRRRLGAITDGPPAPGVDLRGRVALVLGNEARGLDDALRAELDGTIAVPMQGAAESLNVAMAGTVLAFEAARQRGAVNPS